MRQRVENFHRVIDAHAPTTLLALDNYCLKKRILKDELLIMIRVRLE